MRINDVLGETRQIAQFDMNERVIRDLVREACGFRRKLYGMIGDVRVGMAETGRHRFFTFARNGTAHGAAMLVKSTMAGQQGSYVTEIGLLEELRYQGIGYAFYKLLLSKGETLFSGGSQTPDGSKVWRKLLADPDVTVTAARVSSGDDDQEDQLTDPATWSDPDVHLIATRK